MAQKDRASHVLYISYDGLSDPLGQSQILPYLKGLSKNRSIHWSVLSYEKDISNDHRVNIEKELLAHTIEWLRVCYHRGISMVSKIYDLIRGLLKVLSSGRRYDIIHARSYVAAFLAYILGKIYRSRFIFDMRGFWPEERVEGGLWKKDGIFFRISKFFEKKFLKSAEHVVVLTAKARDEMLRGERYPVPKGISVIPTCVDTERFYPTARSAEHEIRSVGRYFPEGASAPLPRTKGIVLPTPAYSFCYSGSLGTWYCLSEMIDFISFLKKKNLPATLHLVINERSLKNIPSKTGEIIKSKDFISLESSSYDQLPFLLGQFRFGIYFIRPSYSKTSSCPTKLAEFLAMGMPVITNRGIGDCDEWIEKEKLGVLIDDFTADAYLKASQDIETLFKDPAVSKRCVCFAREHLSLKVAINRYESIYKELRGLNFLSIEPNSAADHQNNPLRE